MTQRTNTANVIAASSNEGFQTEIFIEICPQDELSVEARKPDSCRGLEYGWIRLSGQVDRSLLCRLSFNCALLQAGPFDIIRHLMELHGLRQKDLGVSTRNTSVLVDITRNEEHNHSAIERAFSFPRSKYQTIQHPERAKRKAIVFLGLVVATSACFSQTE
jgi:hypothetical protein